MINNENKETIFLSIARVFAIFWVILVQHNFAPYSKEWGWCELDNNIFNGFIWTGIITPCTMPIVFCVAGFLFLYKKGDDALWNPFIKKKIIRLLIPCLVLGVVFSLIKEHRITLRVFYGYAHLWFIFDLFVIFIVAKFLKHFTKYFITANFCVIFLGLLVGYESNINGIYVLATSYMFFFLGYCLCWKFDEISKYKYIMYIICIVGVVVKICFKDYINGQIINTLYATLMLFPILFVFYALQKKEKLFNNHFFIILSKYSYGCYLFHMIFLYIIYDYLKFYQDFLVSNYWWLSTVIAFSTIPLSIMTTYLVNKIGFRL